MKSKIIIIAPGPSLNDILDNHYETLKIFRKQGHTIIAIGSAIFDKRVKEIATTLYHCDAKWWNYYKDQIDKIPDVYKLSLEETEVAGDNLKISPKMFGIDFRYGYVVTGRNSGYQALNYAAHSKPDEIILVGFDMQDDGNKHLFNKDKHPDEIFSHSDFNEFIYHFNIAAKELEQNNIKVYNCSLNSALKCFEKKPITKLV